MPVVFGWHIALAQYNRELIQTDVVLHEKREHFDQYLKENVIAKTFTQPLDSNSEYKYESACLAASQFMLANDKVKAGFDSLFLHYYSLELSTKRALLEAVYGLFPTEYIPHINSLFKQETDVKLFCMQAVYLWRQNARRR